MTSTKITMTKNSYGKYQYEFTVESTRVCVASNMPGVSVLSAYLVDTNLPKPVLIGYEKSSAPSLWINVVSGMKIRLISDLNPTSITIIK